MESNQYDLLEVLNNIEPAALTYQEWVNVKAIHLRSGMIGAAGTLTGIILENVPVNGRVSMAQLMSR